MLVSLAVYWVKTMLRTLPTVRIDDGDDGYIVINESDFDSLTHRLFVDGGAGGGEDDGDRRSGASTGKGDGDLVTDPPFPPDPPLSPDSRAESIAARADHLFSSMTLTALRQAAGTYSINGRSTMDQRQLADAIAAAEADSFDGAEE